MQCLTTWVVRSVDEVNPSRHEKTWLTKSDQEQAKGDPKNKSNNLNNHNNPINPIKQPPNPDPIFVNVAPRLLLPSLNFKVRR
jgi:hypothetical protein